MPGPVRRRGRAGSDLKISPADYAAFIGQIELIDLWLQSSNVENRYGPERPDQAGLGISTESRFEPFEDGFRGFDAYHRYQVRVERDGDILAEVEATFGVRFRSDQPMTPDIFDVFAEVNLPVNTWPYFREFLSTTMGRMGWTPFTLPAFKRGTPSVAAESGKRAPRRSRGKQPPE